MYEKYTRQALPQRKYRELIGSSICVFNANVNFIIENILNINKEKSWHELIDLTAGKLLKDIAKTLASIDKEICAIFQDVKDKRDRIVHSFQITCDEEQMLATKTRDNIQFIITEEYLLDFIKENEKLCDKLYEIRRKIKTT